MLIPIEFLSNDAKLNKLLSNNYLSTNDPSSNAILTSFTI